MGAVLLPVGFLLFRGHPGEGGAECRQRSPARGGGGAGVEPRLQDGLNLRRENYVSGRMLGPLWLSVT